MIINRIDFSPCSFPPAMTVWVTRRHLFCGILQNPANLALRAAWRRFRVLELEKLPIPVCMLAFNSLLNASMQTVLLHISVWINARNIFVLHINRPQTHALLNIAESSACQVEIGRNILQDANDFSSLRNTRIINQSSCKDARTDSVDIQAV
mgnify:CR=1 FL=1